MKKNSEYLISFTLASFLVGCGGGSSGSNTSISPSVPSVSTTLTIVDPYIVGATVFWDKNINNIKDAGEPESSTTNENGQAVITTDVTIPIGAILVMNTKGKHGGEDYTGTLKAKHNVNGVISPLTTLETFGFSKTEIVTLLGGSILEDDIIKNPMQNIISTKTTVTENDIKLIKANMAVNTFLEINGFTNTKDNLTTNSDDLEKSLNLMNILISTNNVTTTNNALNIVKSALAINNYVLSQNNKESTLDDLIQNTNGNRDNYFNLLLTNLATNSTANVKLENNGTVSEIFTYSMDEFMRDIKNKGSFSVEYSQVGTYPNTNFNTDYMSYWNNTGFYEYDGNTQIIYPNINEPTFTLETKKIDEEYYGNYLNGNLNDICKILTYKKINSILNISVDAVEVKTFCSYEESGEDGEWEDVSSEFGSDRSYYNFPSSFSDIHDFKDILIEKDVWMGEDGIYLQSNNKLKDSFGNSIEGYWAIENNILKIKYFDEIWYKIENGKPKEFWRADTQFTYLGISKTKSEEIIKVLNPNMTF